MLCICKCKREVMSKAHFEVYCKDKYCPECGKELKLIEQPVIGVRVQLEGDVWESEAWITLKELKEMLECQNTQNTQKD